MSFSAQYGWHEWLALLDQWHPIRPADYESVFIRGPSNLIKTFIFSRDDFLKARKRGED
jgi:hypothetical protein